MGIDWTGMIGRCFFLRVESIQSLLWTSFSTKITQWYCKWEVGTGYTNRKNITKKKKIIIMLTGEISQKLSPHIIFTKSFLQILLIQKEIIYRCIFINLDTYLYNFFLAIFFQKKKKKLYCFGVGLNQPFW